MRIVTLAFALFSLAACNNENQYTTYAGDQSLAVCGPFCDQLYQCGSIDADAYSVCTSHCAARHSADPDATRQGCECVAQSACGASATTCPGAPFPPIAGDGGSGGADPRGGHGGSTTGPAGSSGQGGSGASSGGSGYQGYACSVDNDCASNEDCLDGTCRSRCHASCQCHAGEVCEAGHCAAPVAPPASCATDCDCAAGQACVGGQCG